MKAEVHILIAEDDDGHAILIKKNLKRAGITNPIHHFKDGQETGLGISTLNIAEEGEYYVEVISDDECSNISQVINVSISQPIAYIDFDNGILTNQDQWSAYQWYMDGNIIDGATEATYTPTADGEYYCAAVLAGCDESQWT